MAAGQFVFPAVIVGFLVFFGIFLVSTPALPPLDRGEGSPTERVEPGDTVYIEYTGYYGEPGKGFAYASTQEERFDALPVGRYPPSKRSEPIGIVVDPQTSAAQGGLPAFLLGHRVGDRFTTPPIPPDLGFGAWDETRALNRTLATIPVEVRYDGSTVFQGQPFNATRYLAAWQRLGQALSAGTEWPCESEALWMCRVTALDEAQNVVAYRRLVADGATYPITGLDPELLGDNEWDLSVRLQGEAFDLRLDPPLGARFLFRSALTPEVEEGTYEVLRVDETIIEVNYTSLTNTVPALVGEPNYFDVVIVRIVKPQPSG